MRMLSFILFILLQGIGLSASGDKVMFMEPVAAGHEVTAPWEGECQAAILGDRILSDFLNGKSQGFIINSSCSHESIEKLSALRKLAAEILSFTDENPSREEMSAAADLLGRMDNISVRPLDREERKLIAFIELSAVKGRLPVAGSFTGKAPSAQYLACTVSMAVNFSPQVKLKAVPGQRPQYLYPLVKVNCGKYFYDISYADMYRLFLYVRDSSGNSESCLLTYNFRSYTPLTLSLNLKSHKIILDNTIHNTGAFS